MVNIPRLGMAVEDLTNRIEGLAAITAGVKETMRHDDHGKAIKDSNALKGLWLGRV